jgi:hypothetical protein
MILNIYNIKFVYSIKEVLHFISSLKENLIKNKKLNKKLMKNMMQNFSYLFFYLFIILVVATLLCKNNSFTYADRIYQIFKSKADETVFNVNLMSEEEKKLCFVTQIHTRINRDCNEKVEYYVNKRKIL